MAKTCQPLLPTLAIDGEEDIFSLTLEYPEAFASIVTCSEQMQTIFEYIEAIAISPEPVLITGESGVGKELIAKAIHAVCDNMGQFVPVNIAGLDDTIFSDTLFGHKKGAFTGADTPRKGLIEKAAGGTLFLDEIGDMTFQSQLKLLRLLQEKEYYPLGSDLPLRSDVKIIAATNYRIADLHDQSKFRMDLYYRLKTHLIHIPPLRERKEDIPLLVDYFVNEAAKILGKGCEAASKDVHVALSKYEFPGNIRELRALIFDVVTLYKGDSSILPLEAFKNQMYIFENTTLTTSFLSNVPSTGVAFSEALPSFKEMDQLLIEEALKRSNSNQSKAAQILGISPQALSKRLKL